MFESDSEPMSLCEGAAVAVARVVSEIFRTAVVIYELVAAVKVCYLVALLEDRHDGSVVEVVAGKVHVTVQQGEGTIGSAHPRCGDTTVVAEKSATTAHAATAASHIAHHAACHVIEATVVGIVAIEDDADLALVGETAYHCRTLITPVSVSPGLLKVVSAAG